MKKSCFILILIVCIFSGMNAFSQKTFKCDSERYRDEKTSDKRFNDLVNDACTQINLGNYENAVISLSNAVTLDSINSKDGGTPNQYFIGQLEDLINFIKNNAEESAENSETSKKDSIVATDKNKSSEKKSSISKDQQKKEAERSMQDSIKQANAEELMRQAEEQKQKDAARAIQDSIAKANAENIAKYQEEQKKAAAILEKEEAENKARADALIAVSKTETKEKENSGFSEALLDDFHTKGKQKVHDLEGFIITIGIKSTSPSMAMQAVENAIRLFDTEERTVQVSSVNKIEKPKYPIRTYFQRLRNLNYDNVTIEWADFQYASDFKKARDGTWRGSITFTQRFTSTKDNQIAYSDETTKKIEVILKYYGKEYQGETTDNWDILLGDISVVQTDKY